MLLKQARIASLGLNIMAPGQQYYPDKMLHNEHVSASSGLGFALLHGTEADSAHEEWPF